MSSEFYSLIPTVTGRVCPPPISTEQQLHAKEELLKFYLRMGFEDMEEDKGLGPISGVMDRAVPKTLKLAAQNLCGSHDITNCVTKGQELQSKKVCVSIYIFFFEIFLLMDG